MPKRLATILYAIEFLVALMASMTLWSQAGGQYHLDLMPWYWKLALPVAAAAAATRLTMCVADPATPRKQIAICSLALLLVIACAGIVTYYYHLYEPQDAEENTDENTSFNRGSGAFEMHPSQVTWLYPLSPDSELDTAGS